MTRLSAPSSPQPQPDGSASLEGRLARLFETEVRMPLPSAFVLAALVLAFKAPDSLTNPQFWAEDGPVFFAQQRGRFAPLLFDTYASYLHLTPRFVAWIGSFVSVAQAPLVYCYAAWLLGAAALSSLRWLPMGPVPYVVILAGIALTPTNGEVFGTVTNVQWLFQFHVLAVVARFVTGERGQKPWQQALITLCVGLSGPFSAFGFAACIGLWLLSRVRIKGLSPERVHPGVEFWALGIAAITQSLVAVFSQSSANMADEPVTWLGSVRILSLLQLHALASEPLPRWLFRCWLLAASLATLALLREPRARSTLMGIYAFTVLQLAGVALKFAGSRSFVLATMDNADRYFVMSKAVLFWQVAILVATLTGARRLRPFALMALMFGLPRVYHTWLQRPIFPDLRWKEHAKRVSAGESLDVAIQPEGWKVHVVAEPIDAEP
jgi:hypothetical protein